MGNLRISFVVTVCVFTALPASAQSDGFLDRLTEHFSIRQSLKDKNTINEPAFVTLTIPDEGRETNVVAVAATASVKAEGKNPRYNFGAAMQFNQNSAAASRQNVFQGGGEVVARTGSSNSEERFLFSRIRGTAGYKRNGEKHTAGFVGNAYVTYEKNRPGERSSSIPIGNGRLEFTPQGGIEFDNVISATSDADEGKVWRALLGVKVNAYPVAGQFRDHLVLSADMDYRRDFKTDFTGSDRDHPFAQLSVAVTLDPYGIFSVALDRVMGEDPTQDFAGPNFWRFAFKVQLTRPQKRSIFLARRTRGAHII